MIEIQAINLWDYVQYPISLWDSINAYVLGIQGALLLFIVWRGFGMVVDGINSFSGVDHKANVRAMKKAVAERAEKAGK